MTVTTVLLIKENAQDKQTLEYYYLDQLETEGILKDSVIVLPLLYNTPVKVIAKTAKAYLDKLIRNIPDTVTKLIIADSSYFKFITKVQNVASKYGTTVSGGYTGYEKFECVYVPNYKSTFKQPENAHLIDIGIKAIAGTSNSVVIHSAEFAKVFGADRELLDSLYKYPTLTVDIETTGLTLEDQVATIAFAWTKHDGIAIDLTVTGNYYTKQFLEKYKGKLVFHGGLFDAKLLIRQWWMEHPTDYAGMLEGLQYFKHIDDTMLMAYLAKNATTQVALGLKEVALEYVGHYAIEIEDISKYTQKEVLEYNLIDALGTFFVYEKYQVELISRPYLEIFQPSIYPLLKMMLVGLPMDNDRVLEAHKILSAKEKVLYDQIQANTIVIAFNDQLQQETCDKANAKLKKLIKTIDAFADVVFNPNSGPQLAKLLFDVLKLPVLDLTKTGAPATGAATLADLCNHTTDQDILDLLGFVQDLSEVTKINGTFIKAFMQEKDFLHGNLKLGGTQSGRLSCLVGNSMVLSSEGLVPISDLTLTHSVLTTEGDYKPVVNVWDNGEAPVYQITLANGMQVTGTSNHRFLTDSGYKSLEQIYGKSTFNAATALHPQGTTIVDYPSAVVGPRHSNTDAHKSNQGPRSTYNTPKRGHIEGAGNCQMSGEAVPENTTTDPADTRNVQEPQFTRARGHGQKATSSVHPCTEDSSSALHTGRNNLQGRTIPEQIQEYSLLPISGSDGRDSQASSLYLRWEGLFAYVKAFLGNWQDRKQAHICASSSDDGEFTNYLHTYRVCGPSYQWGQDRQPDRESSPTNQRSAFKTASGYSNIQRVDFMGTQRVYDVEVETDHCYLVNGIWSHNSNSPNLTNLPAHGPMGKIVKSCIKTKPGWLFCAADFEALEEKVGSILSNDPNRIRVYTENYDGHSLRAHRYFADQMPDITAALTKAETATKFWIDDKGEYHCE